MTFIALVNGELAGTISLWNCDMPSRQNLSPWLGGLYVNQKFRGKTYNNEYVGVIRIRETKYDNYKDCGELGALYLLDNAKRKGLGKILFAKGKEELKKKDYKKMIIGCLSKNPSNDFYKHMGGKLVATNPLKLPNGQKLIENLYLYSL